MKSILLWVFAVLFTIGAAIYQRSTGPTYPVSVKVNIDQNDYKFKLIRSDITQGEEPTAIKLDVSDQEVIGTYKYRRYKSYDEWTVKELRRDGDQLILDIPRQPAAGKMMYSITLQKGQETYQLTEEPVIMRYKGDVPGFIIWPHIFFMFFAMLFSTRAGIAAIANETAVLKLSLWTILFLIPGGLILGPIVQKYAFDAYWTGWPFGHDLTDNKTIIGVIFWAIAYYNLRKDIHKKLWPIIASIVLLIVFSIPHSALGSEIDHTKQDTEITE